MEITSTTKLLLQLQNSGACLLEALFDGIGHDYGPSSVITLLWLSHMQSVQDGFGFLGIFSLLRQSVIKQYVTCF
jgi:hypothetical protein